MVLVTGSVPLTRYDLFETPTGWKFFGNLMDSAIDFGGKALWPNPT